MSANIITYLSHNAFYRGADSLSGDRLRCPNLSIKGHAKCVKFMRSFDVTLLLLAGGCYTIQNVACCWCYVTGVALDVEVGDKMPQHEYDKYSSPNYTLHVAPINMENKKLRQLLKEIRFSIISYSFNMHPAFSFRK
ncbi:hypothetical protein WN944_005656 [Citrus x changshan-huyou]|uniref:Histone deacetylase n=1 Tax=Citrus x changshan-huyou TaxID=2935761 RepID=A0AAP0MHR2_9ROSI